MEHVSGTAYSKTNFDGLTAFLKHVRQNQDAFVETYPEAMRLLAEVEGLFQRFRSVLKPPQTVPLVVLAVRCHSLYVTAASAAMAGSTMEVQPLLRAALECSGYAAHLRFNPELEDIWVARADRTDQAARKGVRAHFKHTKICETVDKVGTEVGQSYRTMYDAAIDLGAHPNVIGVMSSFDVQEREYERSIEHHILTADMRKVLHTAALVGQVGMLCVYIMRSVFPAVVPELTDEDFVSPVTLIARLGATIAA